MTDDTEARAAFEFHIWPESERHHGAPPIRMSDGRYPSQGIQAHWETWLAAWTARAPAQDERGDAPTDEALKSAREFIASEREDYIQCCTINGDMTTMDDLDRKGLAEYDTVLALIDADRDSEGAR
jgi:hypothetical protein